MSNARRIKRWIEERAQMDRDKLTDKDRRRVRRVTESVQKPVRGVTGKIRGRAPHGEYIIKDRIRRTKQSIRDGIIGAVPLGLRKKRKKRSRVT